MKTIASLCQLRVSRSSGASRWKLRRGRSIHVAFWGTRTRAQLFSCIRCGLKGRSCPLCPCRYQTRARQVSAVVIFVVRAISRRFGQRASEAITPLCQSSTPRHCDKYETCSPRFWTRELAPSLPKFLTGCENNSETKASAGYLIFLSPRRWPSGALIDL